MADDILNIEQRRAQLSTGLKAAADSMRHCALLTEEFANAVLNFKLTPGSVATNTTQSASDDTTAAAPKGRKRKAAEDGDEKPAKRKRKPKDPNAPKRPASAYIIFQNEIRKELKGEFPNVPNSELLALIAKKWAELPEADKMVYHNAVASAKQQYSQEMKAYESRSPEEVAAANAATAAALALKKATPRTRAPKALPPATATVATVATPTATGLSPSSDSSEVSDSSDDEVAAAKEEQPKKEKDDESEPDSSNDSDDDDEEEEEEPAPPPVIKKARAKAPITPTPVAPLKKKKATKA